MTQLNFYFSGAHQKVSDAPETLRCAPETEVSGAHQKNKSFLMSL